MKIEKIEVLDHWVNIYLEDGSRIFLEDVADCCAWKYFTCDGDDLDDWVGAEYLGWEESDGTSTEDEYGDEHEINFLCIKTDRTDLTVSAHNEHNGYYSGIFIRETKTPAPTS